jgi:MarR family transcriptional regulator, organic hydroperoxide resistance regulator
MKEHPRSIEETRDLYRLYVVFKHTFEAIQRCREEDLKKYNITPEQATALILLNNIGEKATPTEVSGWLFRKPHTVLNLLRRMEKQGLVDMNPDKRNKHIIRIKLTEKGYDVYCHVIQYTSAADTLGRLSKEEQQQLWSLLQSVKEKAIDYLKLDTKSISRLTAALMLPFSDTKNTGK